VKTINVTSDQPVNITSDQPVSIEVRGGVVVVSIQDTPIGSRTTDADVTQPAQRPDRCGALMERSGELCARIEGHNGVHMSAEQVARKQAYNKQRARERYQSDPEYAERVRTASRESHQRRVSRDRA
jgi:hypothetical protein